ncbi:MAG: DUF4258 domain-containing protein [Desulfococcaceae bacterium]|nr:DUF4258 domain-containing protein [Desulfococcaceae bacterium]
MHADDERLNDEFTTEDIEYVLTYCEIIEQYPDDPRGESCLVYGKTQENVPVHIVCGKNSRNHLFIITVYIPKMPKWLDPYTRNRKTV